MILPYKNLIKKHDAVLVAHYYVAPEIQDLAEVSISRMLDFAKEIGLPSTGIGNA